VAVETVVGQVDLAADKPFGPRAIPFENFVPRLEPVQLVGDAAPEFVGVVDRFFVNAFVLGEALHLSVSAEFCGRLEAALLLQDGIDAAGLEIGDSSIGH